MMRPGEPGDGTPSLESLRELRLRALLNDLTRGLGPGKAAEELGVDRKTLRRGQRAAELSPRLAEALERMLLERAVSVAGQDGERVRALEERVAELERQLAARAGSDDGGRDLDGAAVVALREEFAEGMQRLGRRLDQLERGRDGYGAGEAAGAGSQPGARARARRRYADVVTREPADDDEAVYGAAWPLISEWRGLWDTHSPTGRGLAWVSRRQRILDLEVAMLEDHGLTLPQETAPLRGLDRNEQLSWRQRELAGVQRWRAKLELLRWARRVLTLGLWRN